MLDLQWVRAHLQRSGYLRKYGPASCSEAGEREQAYIPFELGGIQAYLALSLESLSRALKRDGHPGHVLYSSVVLECACS